MIVGIYKITNPKGYVYIGQSSNIELRRNYYRRLKCKSQHKIYNSLKKYGWDKHKFEIIEECSLNELSIKERYYQELFSCIGKHGLNCVLENCEGENKMLSEETKRKISVKAKGRKHSEESKAKMKDTRSKIVWTPEMRAKCVTQKGVKLSDEMKAKLNWTGRSHSLESKIKIGNANRGRLKTKESIEKTALKNTGKKRSAETKIKMSNSSKGKIKSSSHNFSISESKGKNIVLNLENGIFYHSIGFAEKSHGIKKGLLKSKIYKNGKKYSSLVVV